MTEGSIQGEAHDAYEQVFGPENSGRVRCVGRGPTPSKYFSNLESTSSTAEIIYLKARLKDIEGKLDTVTNLESTSSTAEMIHLKAQLKDFEEIYIVTNAVCKLVKQFQVSAGDEKKRLKQIFVNHLVSTVIRKVAFQRLEFESGLLVPLETGQRIVLFGFK